MNNGIRKVMNDEAMNNVTHNVMNPPSRFMPPSPLDRPLRRPLARKKANLLGYTFSAWVSGGKGGVE